MDKRESVLLETIKNLKERLISTGIVEDPAKLTYRRATDAEGFPDANIDHWEAAVTKGQLNTAIFDYKLLTKEKEAVNLYKLS